MARSIWSPAQRWRQQMLAIAVLLAVLAVCSTVYVDLIDHSAPRVTAGELRLKPGSTLAAPIRLRGSWRAVRLDAGGAAFPIAVPGQWSGQPDATGQPLPGTGVIRYAVTVRGLAPGMYTLYIPMLYEATRLWIDGRPSGGTGTVGRDAATTTYRLGATETPFVTESGTVSIMLDVAAFHHRDTGIEVAPVLGGSRAMNGWTALQWSRNLLFTGSLLLISLFGLIIYTYRREERAALLLGCASAMMIPVALIFAHDNLLGLAFPGLSFAAAVGVQYSCSLFALTLLAAYVSALFPAERFKWLQFTLSALLIVIATTQIGLAAEGASLTASRISQWTELLRLSAFLYLVAVAVRAARRGQPGAVILLFAIVLLVGTLAMRTLFTSGLLVGRYAFNIELAPLGMLAFLFAQVIIMAERWSLALRTSERMTADQRELIDISRSISSEIKLEALLGKIVRAASAIVRADRSSLFLHDTGRDELWSVIAEGVEQRISFPASEGLAGAVFTSGEPANIANAYDDPRFNASVDRATGYRTQSVLSVPVDARDGRRLGVLQALNPRETVAFDGSDITRLTAFAAQAAIAIDNARLFSEVVTERNYSNSILGSMSSGVITIAAGTGLAKLNAAARRILRAPDDDTDETVGATIIAANPWVSTELAQVRLSGEAKSLIDRDAVALDGQPISANLMIVPLHLEGEVAGLLLIVEDISHGKRLQGTMRRFMSQEVVDHVLANDDGLLFGSACEASILFADIRGFTTMTEQLSPRDTVDMLNGIFTELFEAVANTGGILDKFIGDAIMAVFGAPLPTGRDPAAAVASALQMFAAIAQLNRSGAEHGVAPLRLGIGIASGEVVAGTIGSPKRMEYTVIGDPVNLASRLQDLTKHYGVDLIVDDATACAAAGEVRVRELDTIRVRGREKPVRIWGLRADERGPTPLWEAYAAGRERLAAGAWSEAVAAFERACAIDPLDRPSQLMRDRAAALAADPPGDWDGVWSSAA